MWLFFPRPIDKWRGSWKAPSYKPVDIFGVNTDLRTTRIRHMPSCVIQLFIHVYNQYNFSCPLVNSQYYQILKCDIYDIYTFITQLTLLWNIRNQLSTQWFERNIWEYVGMRIKEWLHAREHVLHSCDLVKYKKSTQYTMVWTKYLEICWHDNQRVTPR